MDRYWIIFLGYTICRRRAKRSAPVSWRTSGHFRLCHCLGTAPLGRRLDYSSSRFDPQGTRRDPLLPENVRNAIKGDIIE